MNGLASLLLLLSLPGARVAPPAKPPVESKAVHPAHKGGQWYFAETGHAVYCYGPVMFVTSPTGDLQRVATFCQNDQAIVPLKE
jgi:hypothetical protein